MFGGEPDGAAEAGEDDEEPDADQRRGDEGFGADGALKMGSYNGNGGGDFVGSCATWVCEERCALIVGGNRCHVVQGEGVVVQQWEIDMRVVVHPGETFLDAGNFQTYEAVENFVDWVLEHGNAKCLVQRTSHFVDEGVQGVVQCGSRGIDPAKQVVINVVTCTRDSVVGTSGPSLRGVVDCIYDFPGEVADFPR